MARKVSARVMLNRAALDEVHLALGEGVEEIVRTIVEVADPPDATPFGMGLVTNGGWLVYSGSKKVAGGSLRGLQPKKPRAFRPEPTGITGMAGFGFPGRFQETGTVHHPAQPFFTPAAEQVARHAGEIMKSVVGPRLRRAR
jgi:hypothetical protein